MWPDPLHEKTDGSSQRGRKILETLCVKYPDDMEARALLALQNMGDDRYGTELMIREILAHQPDHPAGHHYRIHNWAYHEPQQALESARRYGALDPGIGHALHMPGHIFSIFGMWNEAAISMDAATRREKLYMQERLTFPFNNWNYGHNRNYLSYIQEQLGMVDAAKFGARQLIGAPMDPQANADAPNSSHSYGIAALGRCLLKFEQWDELLKEKSIPWRDILLNKVNRNYFEARAYLAQGDLEKVEQKMAALTVLKEEVEKKKNSQLFRIYQIQH